MNKEISLKEFVPDKVWNSNNNGKRYDLLYNEDDFCLTLSYKTLLYNGGEREYTTIIPKQISRSSETFEVLGLLQAEMGKQLDGKIVFCNHEYQLINKVIKWFENEIHFPRHRWKWYIRVNINQPKCCEYLKQVENKVVRHWTNKCGLSLDRSYPKRVSYRSATENKKLGYCDYGTLMIEHRDNILSQIIKIFVKKYTKSILTFSRKEIRNFLRGIIAGESNIEINREFKRYRVYISAKDKNERLIYQAALKGLEINSINYDKIFALVVSKRENNLQLLKQRLVALSPKKYNKFLRMMNFYDNHKDFQEWRDNLQRPHNKIPQLTIDKIIELHHQNPNWPAWKIAEQVGVSAVKVQRVRKENGLGGQKPKTTKEKANKIIEIHKERPSLAQ